MQREGDGSTATDGGCGDGLTVPSGDGPAAGVGRGLFSTRRLGFPVSSEKPTLLQIFSAKHV
jgi:hypothetical protein